MKKDGKEINKRLIEKHNCKEKITTESNLDKSIIP